MTSPMRSRLPGSVNAMAAAVTALCVGAAGFLIHLIPAHAALVVGTLAVSAAIAVLLGDRLLRRSRAAVDRDGDLALRAAIDGVDQGLIVFGPDGRILAWNRMLADMAPSVAPRLQRGMSFEAMVGVVADVAVESGVETRREDYIAQRMAQHARPGESFEVARGNGRRIAICERMTANGGAVISYRDVTAERRAQAAAAQSEGIARDGIESMDHAVMIFDAQQRLVLWNSRLETMLPCLAGRLHIGMSAEALFALRADAGIADDARASWIAERLGALRIPAMRPKERMRDGRILRERVNLRRDGGSVLVVEDVTTEEADATTLANAKAKAEASEARFRDFAEASSDWFWEAGPDGRLTYISSGVGCFGFSADAIVGRRRDQLPYTVPKGQAGIVAIAKATRDRIEFKSVEFDAVTLDGAAVTIAVSGKPFHDADGAYLGHRGTGRNITAARQYEQGLEQKSRLLQTIFTSMGEGISVFDREMKLVAWNDRFIDLTGVHSPVVGMTLFEVLVMQARAGEFGPCDPEIEAEMRIQRQWNKRARIIERKRPDGRTIELRRNPIADGGVVTIYVDITQRKAQEQQLAESMTREREASAQQRRFVAVAAHEFRTPLTIIDGAAQRLMRNAERIAPEDLIVRVEKIRAAVTRMAQLIDMMLNSARLDAGNLEACFVKLDIVGLVAAIAQRQEGVASEFKISVASDPASLEIVGDTRLLDQVFTNLIANAVKYSGTSRRIDVAIDRGADGARVTVRDFGIGVPADEVPKLFTRFFRATTAKGIPGTGIGLNLVKELVALHGGDVRVESRVGAGTTITVLLPLTARPPTAASVSSAAA